VKEWLSDRRLVAGAVLAVAAVVGALAFRGADAAPVQVLSLGREISAGEAVGAADLVPLRINVNDDALGHLVRADRADLIAGRVATRHLQPGELLRPNDLVESGPAVREVSIPVGADHVPSGRLSAGDRVDVLATYGDNRDARTVVVARSIEVVAVTSQQSLIGGGDAGALSAVTVACDERTAALLVFAARSAKVDVARALGTSSAGIGPVGVDDLARAGVTGTTPAASKAGG
jgi:Flp pilus assembly protein CpaB